MTSTYGATQKCSRTATSYRRQPMQPRMLASKPARRSISGGTPRARRPALRRNRAGSERPLGGSGMQKSSRTSSGGAWQGTKVNTSTWQSRATKYSINDAIRCAPPPSTGKGASGQTSKTCFFTGPISSSPRRPSSFPLRPFCGRRRPWRGRPSPHRCGGVPEFQRGDFRFCSARRGPWSK